ncbi:hypothetical protein BS78_02G292400 [Paspalum vaginatum]|nr:hypothetical protein BS78_02G292400 [Paspalum vaginatum]
MDLRCWRGDNLPLIVCPLCHLNEVVELRTVSDENGNQGRFFFKCSRNVPRMAGRCKFYEWPKRYLNVLVDLGVININLHGIVGDCNAGSEEQVADSDAGSHDRMEEKMDALIRAIKLLAVMLFISIVVGMMPKLN